MFRKLPSFTSFYSPSKNLWLGRGGGIRSRPCCYLCAGECHCRSETSRNGIPTELNVSVCHFQRRCFQIKNRKCSVHIPVIYILQSAREADDLNAICEPGSSTPHTPIGLLGCYGDTFFFQPDCFRVCACFCPAEVSTTRRRL
jgi:hypothetical protein